MQMLSVDQLEGRILGEYQIERMLGHGQFGAAYIARQLSQGRPVMITMFNFAEAPSAQEYDQFATRFAQERATLVRLAHPHILPVYDFGEQSGYLYLVTAFVKGASLGQVLKQQGRFTPYQTLNMLKQLAAGLDYAHSQGAVHGILSLSNVLISTDLTVQIAGFGLRTMLEVYGNRLNTKPQASLFSASGTFLGSPEYVSPERVLGKPVDARSDIYALGVMLFELLSDALPFSGENPLDMALKRIQQPVPSVHEVCSDVPEALDLVLSKALERDPAKRYQRAGDIAALFERVLTILEAVPGATDSGTQQLAQGPQLTLPPTVNWFEEAGIPSGKWQLMPPIVTGHMPVVTSSPSLQKTAWDGVGSGQMKQSGAATQPDSSTEMVAVHEALPPPAGSRPDALAGADPFAWWSATSTRQGMPPSASGTFMQRSPLRPASSYPRPRRRPAQQDRRKLVKLMALGTAGVITVSGISFAHFVQSLKQSPSQIANVPTTGSTAPSTTQGNTPTAGPTKGTQNTPTPSKSPTAKPSPSATNGAQPTPTPRPTQPPSPTPTPPSHTGTVIGSTSQPTNSSKSFSNPADGHGSLLIHLSNGNWVACERACTHVGVAVNYDPGSGKLVCPAHGAIFDPLNGFSYVPGSGPPGLSPLPKVTIRVNGDGTITTG
ncbi:MAG TPA: protein kinase [Ktedonobacteraceae bacterium]